MTYDEWKCRAPDEGLSDPPDRLDDEYWGWVEWSLRLERQPEAHELLDPEVFWRLRDEDVS